MRDWKAIAAGLQTGIPEGDVARTLTPLDALEKVFRPMCESLTPDNETTVIYTKALEDAAE